MCESIGVYVLRDGIVSNFLKNGLKNLMLYWQLEGQPVDAAGGKESGKTWSLKSVSLRANSGQDKFHKELEVEQTGERI